MRQLMYISSATVSATGEQLAGILIASRRNNAKRGLSGLLWTDGRRFLQVLEGSADAVADVYQLILTDTRHRAVVVLHDRTIDTAMFGDWAMAVVGDDDDRLEKALQSASPEVRATFLGVIASRRAA